MGNLSEMLEPKKTYPGTWLCARLLSHFMACAQKGSRREGRRDRLGPRAS